MAQQIVIVGNGEVDEKAARAIDAADFVVRFNDCRNFGAAGRRTDAVAVCNTGRPARAMTMDDSWRMHPAVVAAREIWSVRDPQKFAALRQPLQQSHPELDDFCDDHTPAFEAIARASQKRHVVIPASVHEACETALSAFESGAHVCPSSGMMVIFDLMERVDAADATIRLAGFDHAGWHGHPFAAERRFVDFHVAAGRLARLATSDLSLSPSGV